MLFLCIGPVKLSHMTVGVFPPIDTGVILTGDANCPILAEIKGCQVSRWYVGNWGITISRICNDTSNSGG